MLLSVVIPMYNVEKYIERCLDSMLKQDFEQYQIIIVDDGSEDNSLQICREYERKYSKLKILTQKNCGTGYARNAGLEVADGKYIYFCDPDDYIEEDFFSGIIKYLEEDETDLLMFGYFDVLKENQKKKKLFPITGLLDKNLFRKEFIRLFKTNMLYTVWNKIYRNQFLKENNLWFSNAPMGQDTLFNLKVYEYVNSVKIVPGCFYNYIQNRIGSSVNRYRNNRLEYKINELKKIENLLSVYQLSDDEFIDNIRQEILLDSVNQIVFLENMTYKNKKNAIKKILEDKEFRQISRTNSRIVVRILNKRLIFLYYILKKAKKYF